MELDALVQLERDGLQVVGHRPALGENGLDRAVRRHLHQVLAGVQIDVHAARIGVPAREHGLVELSGQDEIATVLRLGILGPGRYRNEACGGKRHSRRHLGIGSHVGSPPVPVRRDWLVRLRIARRGTSFPTSPKQALIHPCLVEHVDHPVRLAPHVMLQVLDEDGGDLAVLARRRAGRVGTDHHVRQRPER